MPRGVYPRNKNGGPRNWTEERDKHVCLLYQSGLSQSDVAKIVGTNKSHVRASLLRTNTPIRGKGNSGPKNPAWKGGRVVDKGGYVLLYRPDHPKANHGNYVQEHRLVMEKILGRHLERREVVHHRNGNHSDNRPENLLLFSDNGSHLGVELLGRVPNWTEDGRKAIRERRIPSMRGTRQCLRGTGVRSSRRKLIQKFLHETSGLSHTGPVALLPQLPPGYQSSKKKRETNTHRPNGD